ncbi:hypothetical protein ACVWYN_001416 [Pedobacter sp. UYP24]
MIWLLNFVKKKSDKIFAIRLFFRIIVKGISDFARMIGYLTNQVYIFINQAMNRTFTKNSGSEVSLQHYNHYQKHNRTALAESALRMTNKL